MWNRGPREKEEKDGRGMEVCMDTLKNREREKMEDGNFKLINHIILLFELFREKK